MQILCVNVRRKSTFLHGLISIYLGLCIVQSLRCTFSGNIHSYRTWSSVFLWSLVYYQWNSSNSNGRNRRFEVWTLILFSCCWIDVDCYGTNDQSSLSNSFGIICCGYSYVFLTLSSFRLSWISWKYVRIFSFSFDMKSSFHHWIAVSHAMNQEATAAMESPVKPVLPIASSSIPLVPPLKSNLPLIDSLICIWWNSSVRFRYI